MNGRLHKASTSFVCKSCSAGGLITGTTDEVIIMRYCYKRHISLLSRSHAGCSRQSAIQQLQKGFNVHGLRAFTYQKYSEYLPINFKTVCIRAAYEVYIKNV